MNYTQIVNASKGYADREDIEVSESMPIFVAMAEARMNRVLKTREQSTRAYTPTLGSTEFYPLPPDYAGMRDVQVSSSLPSDKTASTFKMSYVSPETFNTDSPNLNGGQYFYTVIANQIQIYPLIQSGFIIEMAYWQKVPPLTLDAGCDTNWMSTSHPDIYLAGIVAEIESFAKNYQVAGQWDEKMTRSINELKESDIKENWSGSQLVMRCE